MLSQEYVSDKYFKSFLQILIKHLQEQISEHQRHQEALLVSQMREEFLQKEVCLHLDLEYLILMIISVLIFIPVMKMSQIVYS